MMKKLILLMVLSCFCLFGATDSTAQTPNDKWVTLGEYVKSYEAQEEHGYVPGSPLDLEFISKMAFKKVDAQSESKYDIGIISMTGYDAQLNPVSGNNSVDCGFSIFFNGKRIKKKDIPMGDDGYMVYDFGCPMSIDLISGWIERPYKRLIGFKAPIFENIKVCLDESLIDKDAAEKRITTLLAEKKEKQLEDIAEKALTKLKNYDMISDSAFTDNDGQPYHKFTFKYGGNKDYIKEFRMFAKDNDDIAIFRAPEDYVNNETLETIKGEDRPIGPDAESWGTIYRITLKDGVTVTKSPYLEIDGILSSSPYYIYVEKIEAVPTITYAEFMNSDKSGITKEIQDEVNEKYSDAKLFNHAKSKEGYVIWPGSFEFDRDYIFGKSGDKSYKITANEVSEAGTSFMLFRNGWKDLGSGIYDFGDGNKVRLFNDRVDKSAVVMITLDDGTKLNSNDSTIVYPNGDVYKGIFSVIGWDHPDNVYIALVNAYYLNGNELMAKYNDGVLTKSNGEKVVYIEGRDPEEQAKYLADLAAARAAAEEAAKKAKAEKAKQDKQAVQAYKNELYKKYDKASVDKIMQSGVSVGMPIGLVAEVYSGLLYRDESSTNGTWYKLVTDIQSLDRITIKYIHADSNGKITYIGSSHNAGTGINRVY